MLIFPSLDEIEIFPPSDLIAETFPMLLVLTLRLISFCEFRVIVLLPLPVVWINWILLRVSASLVSVVSFTSFAVVLIEPLLSAFIA